MHRKERRILIPPMFGLVLSPAEPAAADVGTVASETQSSDADTATNIVRNGKNSEHVITASALSRHRTAKNSAG